MKDKKKEKNMKMDKDSVAYMQKGPSVKNGLGENLPSEND